MIKFFKLLLLSSIFCVLVTCGEDAPSETAPPSKDVASSEIEVATAISTPIATITSTVVKTPVRDTTVTPSPAVEVIATVERISASAEPVTDDVAKASISPAPMQQQLTWPIDVGTNHFGALGNTLDGVDGGWIRPLPGRFIWGLMEPEKGEYLWTGTDRWVQKWQDNHLGVLVTIWPFAQWDQDGCHNDDPPVANPREFAGLPSGLFVRMYAPCDPESYASWLGAVVERYDGDGIDDMPGLKYPIRHWEVLNEPEMQGPELTFYQEDSNFYLELLKLSYQAIKAADSNSLVLLGGQAGMQSKFVDYWQPIIQGAAGYFDIGNIHSISSRDLDFFASEYREFLDNNAFERTRFWVTEALVGTPPGEQKLTDDELARRTMTGYASSFAAGANVIFNVGGHDPTGGPGRLSAKTVELMAQTLGTFNTVFQLDDNLVEFEMPNGNSVFVLWDNAVLPPTVSGKVTVIDYLGNENIEEATQVSGSLPKMAIVDSKQ